MSRTNFDTLLEAGCHFGHLKESGIHQWLLIFSWNAMVFISLTSTKQLLKVDEAAEALKQIAKSGKKILLLLLKTS